MHKLNHTGVDIRSGHHQCIVTKLMLNIQQILHVRQNDAYGFYWGGVIPQVRVYREEKIKKDKNNVVNVIIVIYVAIVNVTSYITFHGSKKKLHNYRLAR